MTGPAASAPSLAGEGRRPRVRPYPHHELPRLLQVQVDLGRVLFGHLSVVLDAAAAASPAGRARLEGALSGRLVLVPSEPYLFPAEGVRGRTEGAVLLLLELLGPPARPAVLAVDEGLYDRLLPGPREDGLVLLREALAGAPVRVVELCSRDEAQALLQQAGGFLQAPAQALALDFRIGVRDAATRTEDSGWGRLLFRANLRLGVPPPPEGRALLRLWQRRERLADVPVTLRIEAGYGLLRSAEVAGLLVGDVVLLDWFGPRPVVGGPVWLRLAGGVWSAYLDGEGVTLLDPFHLRGPLMMTQGKEEQDEGRGPAAEGPGPESERLLRELPVQVTCEIGRVTMTGREVLELRPGAVLPVGRPLAGPVDLTAGGRVIARGELVDVEGEIGVRITEVID